MDRYRLGVVSYLNSQPLVYGLGHAADLELVYAVPSRLSQLLDSAQVDVALVPVVDLVQPSRRWSIVSDACIGCDGETFTVRVFSRIPPREVTRLHVDGDSNTSVALADVIWSEVYGRELSIERYDPAGPLEECQAILLIGDKVVQHGLIDFDIETDLGTAWKSMTGLPFVFAVWAGVSGPDYTALGHRLNEARDRGMAHVDEIAEGIAPSMGWPVELARRYLTRRLQYRLTPRHREGMTRFLDLARRRRLIPADGEVVVA